ncbi:MAG: NERD domain-containing protein [Holophagales bacterium]|nr:NERD domain-containing protein [Holophagales bacterium]
MPTLIPSLPIPPTPAASAAGEAKVLLAFQSLRDDFRIYHRKSWYSFDGPDGSREGVCEGEADFLVLHPDLGMLVLEVKGGRIAFDGRTGAWTSTARDGTVHSIKDPFLQAQRSVKAIAAKAAALSFEGQAMPEFVHGHAVVFPDCDFTSGGGGVSAPRELVIDAGDLARDAAGRLMEIFRLWGVRRAAAPLTKKWVKRLGQHVLAPHFSLGLALGSALGWEEKALALLHEEQDICLDFLHLNPRAVVRGGAGTGKTVVAVERARRLAADGKDVLLLCFNRPLAFYLRGICASWEALPGRVWAGSYHELGRELCGRAGVAWNEPPEDDVAATQAFWNETSGVLLLEAAQKLGERFDALVVDEAQDFLTEWWAVLEALLKEGDRAPVTLVADPDQDLWQRESRFPAGLPVFPLRTNCRNTSAIAEYLGELTGSHPRVSPWTVRGEEPKIHRWRNAADEREKAGALIAQLLLKENVGLERVAIVGMRRLANSCLAGVAELAGFPVVPIGDDGTAGVPGALRYATPHRFKGLEADVVLLLDVDGSRWSLEPRNLYVAASRARLRLHVFVKEGVVVPGGGEPLGPAVRPGAR